MSSFNHFHEYRRRERFERIETALMVLGRSVLALVIVGLVAVAILGGVA